MIKVSTDFAVEGDKMIRCNMCGAPVKPWFEVCYECYNPTSRSMKIPEPIIAKSFMQKMGIDGWR
ncbi:hypothetical protein HYX07_05435 [Candidatus Woesearchaeota archaeon]|nr:hypothetical protein [Candidatus Woesearchaeota archaeon]